MAEPAPTTPVAASDVFGSSMSPAQAKAEIAAIINDPARGKLVATKVGWGEVAPPEVLAAKSQWNQLHAVAFPKPQQYSADEINKMPQHHDARRQAEMNSMRAVQMRAQGYSDLQAYEVLNRRPLSPEQHAEYEAQYQSHKADTAFMARWSAGDREAIAKMALLASGRKLPVGTPDQIAAWERAHQGRLPNG
jgi:hypothetical protein